MKTHMTLAVLIGALIITTCQVVGSLVPVERKWNTSLDGCPVHNGNLN
jgi:hypothetical protein